MLFLHLPITVYYGRLSILVEIDLVELFEVLEVVSVHDRIDLLLIHLSQAVSYTHLTLPTKRIV